MAVLPVCFKQIDFYARKNCSCEVTLEINHVVVGLSDMRLTLLYLDDFYINWAFVKYYLISSTHLYDYLFYVVE
jgi:hypothetical protein